MSAEAEKIIVDVTGETCPIPLVEMRKAIMRARPGQLIEVKGTHSASKKEIPMALESLGKKIVKIHDSNNGVWHIEFRN